MAYTGFSKLEGQLAKRPGVTNPGALAAVIGREKYGPAKFDKAAVKGDTLRRANPLTPRQKQLQGFVKRNPVAM